MRRDRLHPSMYLPGPHKSTAELVLCDRPGPQASGARAKRSLLLEPAQLAGGGLTAAHLGALLAAGCLEEGCISHKRPARTGKPNQPARARDLQHGLLLTECGRAVFACYLDRLHDRGAKDLWITKAVQAFRRMAERPLWKAVEGELWWRGMLVSVTEMMQPINAACWPPFRRVAG